MVCCGLGRDESVGSAVWRAYLLTLVLASGLAGVVGLMAAAALSGLSGRCRSWRGSCRAFLTGTVGPRLARFVDREMFVGLAPWRCRITGRLVGRAPRLAGMAYRYFNIAVLASVAALGGILAAIGFALG